MLATALSATLVGLQAHPVRVEVDATRGPPFFELVGLAEAAEAALVDGLDVRIVGSLDDLVKALRGAVELPIAERSRGLLSDVPMGDDLADVRGQLSARRA